MRFYKKYKPFLKLKYFLKTFQSHFIKILNFKRSKWKLLQKQITKLKLKAKKFKPFKNNLIIFNDTKRFVRLKNNYKESLQLKNSICFFFCNCFTISYFKKQIKNILAYKNILVRCFFKPLFSLNILLWKLGLFKSCYEINKLISSGKFLVNNSLIFRNTILMSGDIISLPNFNFVCCPKTFMNSFIEMDFYLNQIIIIKDSRELSYEDFYILINETIDLKKFKSYINTK